MERKMKEKIAAYRQFAISRRQRMGHPAPYKFILPEVTHLDIKHTKVELRSFRPHEIWLLSGNYLVPAATVWNTSLVLATTNSKLDKIEENGNHFLKVLDDRSTQVLLAFGEDSQLCGEVHEFITSLLPVLVPPPQPLLAQVQQLSSSESSLSETSESSPNNSPIPPAESSPVQEKKQAHN